MECDQFESELQRRQDARMVLAAPELEAHAANCSACQSRLTDALLLESGIAAWLLKPVSVSAEFADRLTAQLQQLQRQSATSRPADVVADSSAVIAIRRPPDSEDRPRVWQGAAVCAATVAAVWLVFAGSLGNGPQSIAVRPSRPAFQPALPAPAADLGTVLASAQGAYSHMANDSLAAARDLALLWPTTTESNPTPASSNTPNSGNDAWDADLSKDLAPISSSFGDALEFLKRTVPQSAKSST